MRTFSRTVSLVAGVSIALLGIVVFGHLLAERQPAQGQEKGVVVIASWGGTFQDAQRKAYFAPFERETGIKVIEATGPTYAKVRAMVMSKNVEWDIAEEGEDGAIAFAADGILEKLDYDMFDKSVLGELDPIVINPYYIGTVFYSEGITYSTKSFPKGNHPRTWADVWDVQKFPGPRALYAGGHVTTPIEFALLADGVPPDRLYPLDLPRAYRSLDKIKPSVVKWVTAGHLAIQALLAGEATVVAAPLARIPELTAGGAPIDFEWNQARFKADYWVILKGAKNYRNAMKFIEFASRAKPQAELSKLLPYGPVNRRAFEYVPPETARQLASHPDNVKKQFIFNARWWAERDASGKTNIEKNIEMWNAWILR